MKWYQRIFGFLGRKIGEPAAPAPVPMAPPAAIPVPQAPISVPPVSPPVAAPPALAALDLVSVTSPAGTVRTYPRPLPDDVNLFTYATRLSQIVNPATGQPYYPPGATGITVQFPSQGRFLADCVDQMMHPADWGGPAPDPRWQEVNARLAEETRKRNQSPAPLPPTPALPPGEEPL